MSQRLDKMHQPGYLRTEEQELSVLAAEAFGLGLSLREIARDLNYPDKPAARRAVANGQRILEAERGRK